MAEPASKYFVRLANCEGYEALVPKLEEISEKLLMVEHNGEREDPNSHYHFAITLKKPMKIDAYRKAMRKIFDQGKGNGHMSIKIWDGTSTPLSYMFHERQRETPIVSMYGYTMDDIERYIEENAIVQAQNLTKKRASPFNLTLDWMHSQLDLPSSRSVHRQYVEILISKGMLYPGTLRMRNILSSLWLMYHQKNNFIRYNDLMEELFLDLQ